MYRLLAAESRSECKASPAFVSGVNAKNFSLINVAAGTSALDMIASARAARAGGTSLISSLALAWGRLEKKSAIGDVPVARGGIAQRMQGVARRRLRCEREKFLAHKCRGRHVGVGHDSLGTRCPGRGYH